MFDTVFSPYLFVFLFFFVFFSILKLQSFFLQEPINFVWGWLLIFFFIFEAEMYLSCSNFPDWTLECHKEECRTEYYKNTLFISFILLLSSSALRQPLGGVLQKSGSATALKPIKKGVQIFIIVSYLKMFRIEKVQVHFKIR